MATSNSGSGSPAPAAGERREAPRSRFNVLKDILYGGIRTIARHAQGFYTAVGIYLVSGALIAIAGIAIFAVLARFVRAGATQAFDDAVMRWMGSHRIDWIEHSLLEITALGTGLVVMTIVVIAALFLSVTKHRYSAFLLVVATGGGILLNSALKVAFNRPRPQLFEWATDTYSTSFPSGHAMSAAIVYSTVAYLAARLEKRRWMRLITMTAAFALILLISVSRLYLGVHYPSDVAAGVVVGLAWAAFCMAGLEAVQVFARRFKPKELRHERDLKPEERKVAGFEP